MVASVDTIFNFLGLKAKTTIGEFFLEVIKEFIENVVIMNPTHIGKYFSDDGCKFISKDLIQVLGESGGDILLRVILKKISDPIFLNISFEDFINQNKKNISLLCDHVSISADLNSTYKVEFSKINVGKYKRFLNKNEIEIIEDELSEYL